MATLYKGNNPVEIIKINEQDCILETNNSGNSIYYKINYRWQKDSVDLVDQNNNILEVGLDSLSSNDSAVFTCTIYLEQVRQEEENE